MSFHKVEQKVKKEITNKDEGYGAQIFDPVQNGRNFIINVLSTKKQDDGRTWPDYSTSDFSRRQYALGDDDEIKAFWKPVLTLKHMWNQWKLIRIRL
jgi:hypothetical protein